MRVKLETSVCVGGFLYTSTATTTSALLTDDCTVQEEEPAVGGVSPGELDVMELTLGTAQRAHSTRLRLPLLVKLRIA